MRSSAQVGEIAGAVNRNGHGLIGWVALFVSSAMLQTFNKLQFVRLVFEEILSLSCTELAQGENLFFFD